MTKIQTTLASLLVAAALGGCGGGGEPSSSVEIRPQQLSMVAGRTVVSSISSPAEAESVMPKAARELAGTTNVLLNGDFESNSTAWIASEGVLVKDGDSYAGSGYAWLGGYNDAFDRIAQTVAIPAGASEVSLQYWYRVSTNEKTATAYDGMAVAVHNPASGAHLVTLKLYTNLDKTNGWVQSPAFDLSSFKGQLIELRFTAITDESDFSSFRVDDVVLSVTTPAAAVPNGTTLQGNYSDYLISKTATGFTVKDRLRSGTVQTFSNGDRLHFSDVSVALGTSGTAAQVYRLYQAAFNRKPDLGGLGYQIAAIEESGLPLTKVSHNFINSPEFTKTYGSLDNTQFVTQLYANVLHRAPDSAGLAYHVGRLNSNAITRADVLIGFSESPENQSAVADAIGSGIVFTPLTPVVTPPAITCVAPKTLVNGVCVTPTPTCTAAQVLRDGVCVARTVSCVAPAVLQNGGCVFPIPTCEAPKVLQSGICVTPVTTCPAPKVLQNGVCVTPAPTPTPVVPPTCGPNQVLQNNVCVAQRYSCYPWNNAKEYIVGNVVSSAGNYYSCAVASKCRYLEPGVARYWDMAWAVSTATACGTAPPALNGRIVLEKMNIGYHNSSDPSTYSYANTSNPSFYPELLNDMGETLTMTVCFARTNITYRTEANYGYNACTRIDAFKPNTTVKVKNLEWWAHGEFRVYVTRSEDLDPTQQQILVGTYSAGEYGFVPVPPPPRGCITNGSIPSRDPACNTLTPPPAPTPTAPVVPPAPSTPTAGTTPNAMRCVSAVRAGDTVTLKNNCGQQIFVIYCGQLKYSKSRCGDSKNYFTHSRNSKPGEISESTDVHLVPNGTMEYGACFGGIGFTNDNDFKAYSNGTFECMPD